jgi:hypothetical protein
MVRFDAVRTTPSAPMVALAWVWAPEVLMLALMLVAVLVLAFEGDGGGVVDCQCAVAAGQGAVESNAVSCASNGRVLGEVGGVAEHKVGGGSDAGVCDLNLIGAVAGAESYFCECS